MPDEALLSPVISDSTSRTAVPTPSIQSDPPSSVSPPALRVPGYELAEEIGRGGLGVVYKAWQQSLSRWVAIKFLQAGAWAEPRDMQRFRDEAEALAKLQHPGVVQVIESGQVGEDLYLVLEYLAAGNLARKIAGTPQPPEEAARLVETLARAMQAVHAKQILHRDLKPANVLLDEQGQPKITDFGLAKRLDRGGKVTTTGAWIGTPFYMAPEQIQGLNESVDARTDVYALGAMLYELLTGRPPFKGENDFKTFTLALESEPATPRQLVATTPVDLENICLKCLSKEPARRYGSAENLADDLRRFLDGKPVLARPEGLVRRVVRWGRRNPLAAGLSLTALTAGVALLTLTTVLYFREAHLRTVERERVQASERAAKAEGESQAKTVALRESAIVQASQRGNWKQVLTLIDDAAAQGVELTPQDEIHKFNALLAVNRRADAAEALAGLSKRTDLGQLDGEVLLLSGDLALSRSGGQADGLRDIERALELGLRPASRAYAEGLRATKMKFAVEKLDEAIRLEPFHYRARGTQLVLLCLQGRHVDVQREAQIMKALFPDDQTPHVAVAFSHLFRGDKDAALVELRQISTQLDDEDFKFLERIFAAYDGVSRLILAKDVTQPWSTTEKIQFTYLFGQVTGLISEYHQRPRVAEITADFQSLPCLTQSWGQAAGVFSDLMFGRNDAAVATATKMSESHPDGFFYYLQAHGEISRLLAAGQIVDGSNCLPPENLLRQALQNPTILGSYRKEARFSHLRCSQYPLYKKREQKDSVPQPDSELGLMRAQAVVNLMGLAREETLSSAEFSQVIELAYAISEYAVAEAVLDEWAKKLPNDDSVKSVRVQHLRFRGRYEEAWEAFQKIDPDSPVYKGTRELVEAMLAEAQAKGRLKEASLAPIEPATKNM